MTKGGNRTLRILGFDYKVEMVVDQSEIRAAGDSRPHCSVIRIARDQNEQQRVSTLLHEVLHMIMFHMCIDQDEALVGKLETGVYAFFKDNNVALNELEKLVRD